MIKSIRHKALRRYWETGGSRGLNKDWLPRLNIILNGFDAATGPEEMNVAGLSFHALSGDLKDYYSVKVTANFRVIFQHDGEGFILIDLVDYH